MALKDKWVDKINGVDYVNAQDINEIAHTAIFCEEQFGEGNVRGLKGYWIDQVAPSKNKLRLSPLTDRTKVGEPSIVADITGNISMNTGYARDDEFSIITPKNHHILCGKIVSVNNNIITYQLYSYANIEWNAGKPKDEGDYSFVVPTKYNVGIVKTCEGGFATGHDNVAGSCYSFVTGRNNKTLGHYADVSGFDNIAGYGAHAEGRNNKAIGMDSHSEGYENKSIGSSSHAEGTHTESIGYSSHSEGFESRATDESAHAEGHNTTASNIGAHAEGYQTTSSNLATHAEGFQTNASGNVSHAEGLWTLASNEGAHAEGASTQATGLDSHAEGSGTIASGDYSHAGGYGTRATAEAQMAIGKWNDIIPDALFVVGNGKSDSERSSAFAVVENNGVVSLKIGDLIITKEQLRRLLTLI